MDKVLIIGPSGSGKTYISAKLREIGLNTFDADEISGLSKWVDKNGKKAEFPNDANEEWLNSHDFIWDKDFLKNFLEENEPVLIFGLSSNTDDCMNLFDKVFYLYVSPEVLVKRLQDPSRSNPMGKTEEQRQAIIRNIEDFSKRMKEKGITFIDSTKSPQEVYKQMMSYM